MITLLAFLLTLLIELPIICYWLKKNWKEALLIGFLVNLFTWPLLQVVYRITHAPILMLELIIGLVEGYCFYLFFKKPVWISLVVGILVNAISYTIGYFIF